MNLDEFKRFIRHLAEASSKFILPYFQNATMEIEQKGDQTPVTIADRGAEQLMRQIINDRYPEHGIIGEEFGSEKAEAELVWIMDPIDGTKSFIRGCPLFGSLIALLHNQVPVLGVINLPALGIYCVGDRVSTTVNDKLVQVSRNKNLQAASLLISDPKSVPLYQDGAKFSELLSHSDLYRSWGDCYGYYLVAAGWCDIMLDPIMNPWDLLPLIPIIEGAGGKITAWDGSSAVRANSCVATNGLLHDKVLGILN